MEKAQQFSDAIAAGWAAQVHGQYAEAEKQFRQALAGDGSLADAWYGLGMSLKSQQQKEGAIQAFERAAEILAFEKNPSNPSRASMMRLLARGHINQLNNGDWNLRGIQ